MLNLYSNAATAVGPSESDTAILQVVDQYFASIAFDLEGIIQRANDNFLAALGYSLDEIVGQHHKIFVPASQRESASYAQFWRDLCRGDPFSGQYERVTKDGRSIWIQATYAPVRDETGALTEVVKIASDITARTEVMAQVSQGLEALASGNTGFRVSADPTSEMFDLAETYNTSAKSLGQVLSVVSKVAGGLDQAARDLRQNSTRAAQVTQDNAASVESASDDVSSIVTATATATAEAVESEKLAKSAASTSGSAFSDLQDAIVGAEEMRKVVDAMAGINQTIEAIAFQTNMLALNAGIEAARAGQAGAGFAVVASEIRNLAERSNSASREIKDLIDLAVKRSLSTEEHVKNSGESLEEVKTVILLVAEKILSISASAQQQSDRLSELDATLRSLSGAAQQHADMVDENSRAAEQLVDFGHQLAVELTRFSDGSDAGPAQVSGAA